MHRINEFEGRSGASFLIHSDNICRMWSGIRKRKAFWFSALFVTLAVVLFFRFDVRQHFTAFFQQDVHAFLNTYPVLAPLAYILVYIVAIVVFMPATPMTLVGGAVFGVLWGFVYTSIATTIGGGLSFLVARHVGSDWVKNHAGKRLQKLQAGIEQEGARFIAFTRLVPLFPFNLLNYLFGLTRISFWTFLGLSWLCMIPGTFAYVYLGYAFGATLSGSDEQGIARTMLIVTSAVGVLVLLSMIPKWINYETGELTEEDEYS